MKVLIAMRRQRPRRGWNEGAVAVEAAISFLVLLLLMFGLSAFGTAAWQWHTMRLAVEQAGRWAMINNADANVRTDAESQMQNVLPGATISCPLPSSPAANTRYVCATQNAGTSPPTMTLSASYGYNVIDLAGPFAITSQTTVPLD